MKSDYGYKMFEIEKGVKSSLRMHKITEAYEWIRWTSNQKFGQSTCEFPGKLIWLVCKVYSILWEWRRMNGANREI